MLATAGCAGGAAAGVAAAGLAACCGEAAFCKAGTDAAFCKAAGGATGGAFEEEEFEGNSGQLKSSACASDHLPVQPEEDQSAEDQLAEDQLACNFQHVKNTYTKKK